MTLILSLRSGAWWKRDTESIVRLLSGGTWLGINIFHVNVSVMANAVWGGQLLLVIRFHVFEITRDAVGRGDRHRVYIDKT